MTAQFISQPRPRRNQRAALAAVILGAGAAALAVLAAAIWLTRLLAPLPEAPPTPAPSAFSSFDAPLQMEPAAPHVDLPDAAKTRRAPRPRPAKVAPAPENEAPADPFAGVEVLEPHELATISQAR